jgi:nitrogen fixation protein FixH
VSCCGLFFRMDDPIMTAHTRPAVPFRLTGRHVLVTFIGFFAIVFTVNGVMLNAAFRTMPGLDARNGYDASQRFNADIAAATAQAERGWKVAADVHREGDHVVVVATFAEPSGTPVSYLAADAVLAHPTVRRFDRALILSETAPGRYEAATADLPAGSWTLLLTARLDPEAAPVFTSRNRLMLRQ